MKLKKLKKNSKMKLSFLSFFYKRLFFKITLQNIKYHYIYLILIYLQNILLAIKNILKILFMVIFQIIKLNFNYNIDIYIKKY